MKKTLFAAALASVALAGCVKNEAEIVQNADSKITFAAPLVSSITRIHEGEINNPYPTEEEFVVFAKLYKTTDYTQWRKGEWYMGSDEGGIVVHHEEGDIKGWVPDVNYYWPKNGSLTFYAYSPADYATWKPLISEGVMESSDVNIPVDAHNVDLLYTKLAKNKKNNENKPGNNNGVDGNAEYNGVEMKFMHALSSIKFKVKLSRIYNNAQIRLKSIVLKDVYSTSTFSLVVDNETANPGWGMPKNSLDYTLVDNSTQLINSVDVADVSGASDMILLPQALTNIVAEVTYTINDDSTTTPREFTTEIHLADLDYGAQTEKAWLPGKRYIYTITFSLQTIIFDPSVTPWEDVEVVYPKTSTSVAE